MDCRMTFMNDLDNGLIRPYPDEPHPDNEWEWKSWWVKKCFEPDKPLTAGALKWIDQCWRQTKAVWCASGGKAACAT